MSVTRSPGRLLAGLLAATLLAAVLATDARTAAAMPASSIDIYVPDPVQLVVDPEGNGSFGPPTIFSQFGGNVLEFEVDYSLPWSDATLLVETDGFCDPFEVQNVTAIGYRFFSCEGSFTRGPETLTITVTATEEMTALAGPDPEAIVESITVGVEYLAAQLTAEISDAWDGESDPVLYDVTLENLGTAPLRNIEAADLFSYFEAEPNGVEPLRAGPCLDVDVLAPGTSETATCPYPLNEARGATAEFPFVLFFGDARVGGDRDQLIRGLGELNGRNGGNGGPTLDDDYLEVVKLLDEGGFACQPPFDGLLPSSVEPAFENGILPIIPIFDRFCIFAASAPLIVPEPEPEPVIELACDKEQVAPGDEVNCEVSGLIPDAPVDVKAELNPVLFDDTLTGDADGMAPFSFTVPATATSDDTIVITVAGEAYEGVLQLTLDVVVTDAPVDPPADEEAAPVTRLPDTGASLWLLGLLGLTALTGGTALTRRR